MNSRPRTSEEDVIDLAQLLEKLTREKLLIIIGAVLGGILGIVYYLANPVYGAVSTLEVRLETDEIYGKALASGDLAVTAIKEADLATAAAKLTRVSFLTRVAGHPDIVSCKNFIPKGGGVGKELTLEERTDILMGWVNTKKIIVEPRRDTFLIDILVKHPNGKTAALLANTIHQVALEEAEKTRGQETNYLINELVSDYQDLATSVNAARSQISHYEDVKRLKEEILNARSQITTLSSEYKSKHPVMIATVEKLAQLNILIVKEIQQISKHSSERAYWDSVPGFRDLIDDVEQSAQLPALAAANQLIPFLDARLSFLDAEFKALSQTYDNVVVETAAAQIANDSAPGNLRSFQIANDEGGRAGLSPIIILAVGIFLGAGLGIGLAILRAFVLKKGVCNSHEWSQHFDLPVIGELLKLEGEQLNPWQVAGSISEDAAHYRQAETVRSIRAHITLLGRGSKKRRLLVTSALPEEGKTTLSTSLALSFARLKTPTLLIDLDLRSPSVHQVLGLPNERGVTDLLLGDISVNEAIQELEGGTLHVITAGHLVSDAPELLSTERLEAVLTDLSAAYEWIIFDSAPLLSVSDTKLIAPFADYSLLTVRANSTELPAIDATLSELKDSGTQVVGAVINFIRSSDGKKAQLSYDYGYGLQKCTTS